MLLPTAAGTIIRIVIILVAFDYVLSIVIVFTRNVPVIVSVGAVGAVASPFNVSRGNIFYIRVITYSVLFGSFLVVL